MSLSTRIRDISFEAKYAFRPHKPLLLGKVLDSYSRAFLGGNLLRYIDIAVDYRCNLNCEHCFTTFLQKPPGAKKMSLQDYWRVAIEARRLGAMHFGFQGGEPLLYPHLQELIAAFQPFRSYINITTNGTLMDRETVLKLRAWGVDSVNFSLDSGIPEEHDSFRGKKGIFKEAFEGLEMARKNGLNVGINTTVSHQSIRGEGFQKLLKLAIREGIVMNPIFAVPVGNWLGKMDILMTEEDSTYIEELRRKFPCVRRDLHGNYRSRGCSAVSEVLYITPYGDVQPCPFIHISLGNVREESLEKIRASALEYPVFSSYNQKCLVGEDREFVARYMAIISGRKYLPVDIRSIPKDLFYAGRK